MDKRLIRGVVALVAAVSLLATACGSDEAAVGSGDCDSVDSVSLQLQWVTQAQFAGYYAAVDRGIYEDYCLDVNILEGGVDIVPQQQLVNGAADFAISWVPKALGSVENGEPIKIVAQVFQRSGTLQVSWADAGIGSDPANLEGKKVGTWGWGNELELVAGLIRAGVQNPNSAEELIGQSFDMFPLLNREIDAAQAMTYNEYAMLLEAMNPATGELYKASDFAVIDWNDHGTAMLQDAIWARSDKLESDDEYRDITSRFVEASLMGWSHCREDADDCVGIVLDNGSAIGESHQAWMMNEINRLIWPSPNGVGMMDSDLWNQTIQVSLDTGLLAKDPGTSVYTNEFAEKANDNMAKEAGRATTGSGWQPKQITLNPGGE